MSVQRGSLSSLSSLNHYLKKYKWYLIGGTVFIIISNYFRVLQPQYFRDAIDTIMVSLPIYAQLKGTAFDALYYHFLGKLLLIFAVFVTLQAIMMGIFMYFMRQTIIVMSRLIEYDMRKDLYDHAQIMDRAFYQRNLTGDIMARITEDVSKVRSYLGPAIMYGISLITLFVAVVFTMFKVNAQLAVYSLLPLPFLSWGIYRISEYINQRSSVIQAKLSDINSTAVEILAGIRVVKSFSLEGRMNEAFRKEVDDYYDLNLSRAKIDAWFFPLMIFVIGLSTVLVLWIGGQQVDNGLVTPGNIAEFFIYITLLTWPMTSLGWTASLVQQAAASQKRINEFMAQKPDLVVGDRVLVSDGFPIELKQVSLRYPNMNRLALEDISFEIKEGEKIAIIGKTGSGKSSLVYLLMRLYQPTNGIITYHGHNIGDYDIQSWRDMFGYVAQDSFLFSDSIENNILFGSRDDYEGDLEFLTRELSIYGEIMAMPNEFETMVGERGITLSGGQKQRLTIARAITSDPKIFIFDDSLSALDSTTQKQIDGFLQDHFKHATIILITQRLETIVDFDKIIVLDQGKIVGIGRHHELLATNSFYRHGISKNFKE